MNTEERRNFWNTLCSLSGEDIEKDMKILRESIKYPRYLYRYRGVNPYTIEALRTNSVYLSTADKYDDPFDTFLHIDIDALKQEYMIPFATKEGQENTLKASNVMLGFERYNVENFTEGNLDEVMNNFLCIALDLRGETRKYIWSACFSENGLNETLWLKYADRHRGFALIYDLANEDNFLCDKQVNFKNCMIPNMYISLYPIYYADKPYDATNFHKLVLLDALERWIAKTMPPELRAELGSGCWEKEKISLIKKKCHEYDEEWRILLNSKVNKIQWIPCGIILGLKMDETIKNLVIGIAKMAGIKEIYQSFINEHNQMDMYLLKL